MRAACFEAMPRSCRAGPEVSRKHVARIARSYTGLRPRAGRSCTDRPFAASQAQDRAVAYARRQILRRRYAPVPARYTVNIG